MIETPFTYVGSGPYCYANSLSMMLGESSPEPSLIEVLTGSPFGMQLLAGNLPMFDPFGWDPDLGLDSAVAALGWECEKLDHADETAAAQRLRAAGPGDPILAGPLEMGLLKQQPGMTRAIGADHFVVVIQADRDTVLFHDPQGFPYSTLPVQDFLAAWRGETVAYCRPFSMRRGFTRIRDVKPVDAFRSTIPAAAAWLRGRQDLAVPPGTLGKAAGVKRLADMVDAGLSQEVHATLIHFAVRVGSRRLADAATWLERLELTEASMVAGELARLIGSLQYDLVGRRTDSASATLRRLAPLYLKLADRLD